MKITWVRGGANDWAKGKITLDLGSRKRDFRNNCGSEIHHSLGQLVTVSLVVASINRIPCDNWIFEGLYVAFSQSCIHLKIFKRIFGQLYGRQASCVTGSFLLLTWQLRGECRCPNGKVSWGTFLSYAWEFFLPRNGAANPFSWESSQAR